MLNWFRDHPWIGTAFAAGALCGLLLFMPLIPYQLPESAANVLGAALGAMMAVWGAAWIADRKERHKTHLMVKAVNSTVSPLLKKAEEFRTILGALKLPGAGSPAIRGAYEFSTKFRIYVDGTEERLAFMAPLFLGLGGDGVISYGTLNDCMSRLRESAEREWGAMHDDKAVAHEQAEIGLTMLDGIISNMRRALAILDRPARFS